jgi:hypothetical protein
MTATTAERQTRKRNTGKELNFPLAAQKALVGTIAVLNAGGFAEMGTTATTKIALGVFIETVDNSGGSAGDLNAPIERGVFKFANSSAGDAIALTDYGTTCYIVDNQTVAKTSGTGTRSVAGVVRGVDADGVWVEF